MNRASKDKAEVPQVEGDRQAQREADRAQAALDNVREGYGRAPAGAGRDPPGLGHSDRVLDDRPPQPAPERGTG